MNSEPLLQKPDLRRVVEHFGSHIPTSAEGDTTSMGTRNPSPRGPATPLALAGSGSTVTYSPGVPAGATGGGTWSKNPSFSSYMMNSTVFDQVSGLEIRVWST